MQDINCMFGAMKIGEVAIGLWEEGKKIFKKNMDIILGKLSY